MEHFYTQKLNISASTLVITDEEVKHLLKVLRKTPGQRIFVTDGEMNLYECMIESTGRDLVNCSIINSWKGINEPSVEAHLYMSILKSADRFEFAIEKAVELGASAVHPLVTKRVIIKERNRNERWSAISLSAMKQSQRVFLPPVHAPGNFDDAVKECKSELKLIAHEKKVEAAIEISDLKIENVKSIAVFIGPEGGFTEDEVSLAEKSGFKILSLGARKFRSETAAIAALSILLA